MYEQTLDMDKFQNFLTQHQDDRFYDTFFDLASMQEYKNSRKLPGLPTPPTTPVTPDKSMAGFQYQMNHPQPHPTSLPLQNHGMQVVPEMLPEMLPSPEEEWVWFNSNKTKEDNYQRNANNEHIQNGVAFDGFIGQMSPLNQQIDHMKRNYENNFFNFQQNMTSNYNLMEEQMRVASEPLHYQYQSLFLGKMMDQQKNIHPHFLNYEPTLSRATHNVLERQRRNDLKVRFAILRDNIPELLDNDKAPKIQILRKAVEYLRHLRGEEQRLLADLELERQRKLILRQRVNNLRHHFLESSNSR